MIPKPPAKRIWSDEQNAVFDYFQNGTGNAVFRARAGTGKTETSKHGFSLAPENKMLYAVFNKKNQREAQEKIRDRRVEIKTLHSLGFGYILNFWNGAKPDDNVEFERLTSVASVPKEIIAPILKLLAFAKNCFLMPDELDLIDVSEERMPDAEWNGFGIERAAKVVIDILNLSKERDELNRISFNDMVWLPVALDIVRPRFDLVLIDEAQDMNLPQLEMAKRASNGRVIVVGDDRQCQPAGTTVRMSDGAEKLIEQIVPGDKVMTFARHEKTIIKNATVTSTFNRPFLGKLVTIIAGGKTSSSTPDHKWLIKWQTGDDRKRNLWITYLMRKGDYFRLGKTRFFYHVPRSDVLGISGRMRQEGAECGWILKAHSTEQEALAYEQIIAANYGLPECCFKANSNLKFTQSTIEKIFSSIPNQISKAEKCLSDHGRMLEFPIVDRRIRQSRRTVQEIQACNLMSDVMSVPVAPDKVNSYDRTVSWKPIKVGCKNWASAVISLNVEPHHKYISDGIITCNCIYGFRGAVFDGLTMMKNELNAKEFPLSTTYRCPKKVVTLAQKFVPDYRAADSAPDGAVDEISESQLVEQAQIGDAILSRANAPLMPICLSFIRRHIPARIEGRDLGKQLLATVQKMKAKSVPDFFGKVSSWATRLTARLLRKKNCETKISQIDDQKETLLAIAEGCDNVAEIENRCRDLFQDSDNCQRPAIILSTVHKAKGLEWNRVFLIRETFLKRQNQEEENIYYVALTRAKKHLTFVNSDNKNYQQ